MKFGDLEKLQGDLDVLKAKYEGQVLTHEIKNVITNDIHKIFTSYGEEGTFDVSVTFGEPDQVNIRFETKLGF